ncbi:unnamed protein product [Haemonchus placei]|uniref:Uncharacterized protein n=1 Tax=Haemonchus placei TaxID=6290 RepID=A0A0N4X8B4_HAEPC|nr:unnamed protein product [Haemonchus placei]
MRMSQQFVDLPSTVHVGNIGKRFRSFANEHADIPFLVVTEYFRKIFRVLARPFWDCGAIADAGKVELIRTTCEVLVVKEILRRPTFIDQKRSRTKINRLTAIHRLEAGPDSASDTTGKTKVLKLPDSGNTRLHLGPVFAKWTCRTTAQKANQHKAHSCVKRIPSWFDAENH